MEASGRPHRFDYLGTHVGDSTRLREEMVALGLIDAHYELPYVSHNPTLRINFRRVSNDELTTNGSVRLQRKICRLMLADYCCLGYPFPAACDYQGLC